MVGGAGGDPEATVTLLGTGAAAAHCPPLGRQDLPSPRNQRYALLAAALASLTACSLGAVGLLASTGGRPGRARQALELQAPAQDKEAAAFRGWAAESFVKLVQTARDSGEKLASLPDLQLVPDFDFDGPVIDIDTNDLGQELVGFGGAFTEASAVTFKKLDEDLQEQFLEHYFGASGMQYTLGRVHINSCDFSVSSYSFDDTKDDFSLSSFDDRLTRDQKALIPLIKRALRKLEEASQDAPESATLLTLRADGKAVGPEETITFIEGDDGHFRMQPASGGYVRVAADGSLSVERKSPDDGRDKFRLIADHSGNVSLRSSIGTYLTAYPDGRLEAQAQSRHGWESFGLTRIERHGDKKVFALRSYHGGYVSERRQRRGLRLLATPWSPPAWMKNSGQMDGSSVPCLRLECRATWAKYIARWISAYKAQGLPIWALSVQNEPTNNPPWEGCLLSAEEEADFLGEHLGPAVKALHPDVAIFVYDDSKHLLPQYVDAALQHPNASKYLQGAAFHWYSGDLFERVAQVRKSAPHVMLLASEATYEKRMWHPNQLQPYSDWRFGEGYAHDIIGDLNAGAAGWIDWNLLLDTTGGPNHVGNSCDAAVVADLKEQKLHIHPQSLYIGHFSKYIPPGSRHVANSIRAPARTYTTSTESGPYGTCTGQFGLETTAFKRPDGWVVVVVLNCAAERIDFKLRHGSGASAVRGSIPAHAIQTYSIPA